VTARPSFQKKTGRPVQFEITEQTRATIQAWLADIRSRSTRYLFPSRVRTQPHLSTRQYARIVHSWVASAGLDCSAYGTHSMSQPPLIQRRSRPCEQFHPKRSREGPEAPDLMLGWIPMLTEPSPRGPRISRQSGLTPGGFVRDVEPPLGQEFLDVSVAQGEAQIKPDRMMDDRRRKAVPAIGDFSHRPSLPSASLPS
jgi:hypothetical protein